MNKVLILIPLLPLAGFLVLALCGGRFSKHTAARLAIGAIGVSAAASMAVTIALLDLPAEAQHSRVVLWRWIGLPGLNVDVALYLDALSAVMLCVVTVVAFLVHIYSSEYMARSEGYTRFFAYMNLFVAAMTTLVLADNLVLLLVGWEGVGLCSYLLIGFWYENPANGRAARKAFIVTRAGDTALFLGLFLLFSHFGILEIQPLLQQVRALPPHSAIASAAALLLLGGAVGKSAQLPLQVWLPDAMAGPTPVSALIHAATMVTAGVYLIARMNLLYLAAPGVLFLIAIVGTLTLLLAACSALTAVDVKRALAYSTISQIGYMFLALGAGAWIAAIFHLVTHAFFKSLLFLGAGMVMHSAGDEHDIFRLGGLRARLPFAFFTFAAGAASLAALPFITAGFYSKDMILMEVLHTPGGGWLFTAALLGSFLTALYAFRLLFVIFFGKQKTTVRRYGGGAVRIPLLILSAGALAAGALAIPGALGPEASLITFLHTALPSSVAAPPHALLARILLILIPLLGAALAWVLYVYRPAIPEALSLRRPFAAVHQIWGRGWGFDAVYQTVFTTPFLFLARINQSDFIDLFYRGVEGAAVSLHRLLAVTQTGYLRTYLMSLLLGTIGAVAVMVLL